jgi:hypothetical protein
MEAFLPSPEVVKEALESAFSEPVRNLTKSRGKNIHRYASTKMGLPVYRFVCKHTCEPQCALRSLKTLPRMRHVAVSYQLVMRCDLIYAPTLTRIPI